SAKASGTSSWRSTGRCCVRPTHGSRTAPSCRTGGSSPSPGGRDIPGAGSRPGHHARVRRVDRTHTGNHWGVPVAPRGVARMQALKDSRARRGGIAAVFCVVALVAAGCGGDDDTPATEGAPPADEGTAPAEAPADTSTPGGDDTSAPGDGQSVVLGDDDEHRVTEAGDV